jgi:hypothetical protein
LVDLDGGTIRYMKQRIRHLKKTAVESLTLAVEVFNQPSTVARTSGVLLHLQHALEMIFKAAILEKQGAIVPKRGKIAYSFSECLGILKNGYQLMDERQALAAALVDSHRDAVQHYGSRLREQALYADRDGQEPCCRTLPEAGGGAADPG